MFEQIDALLPGWIAKTGSCLAEIVGVPILSGLLNLILGAFVESVLHSSFLTAGPTYAIPAFVGVALALLQRETIRRRSRLVWIPLTAWVMVAFVNSVRQYGIAGTWQDAFGRDCTRDECLGQILLVAPWISTVAYSITAVVRLRAKQARTVGA